MREIQNCATYPYIKSVSRTRTPELSRKYKPHDKRQQQLLKIKGNTKMQASVGTGKTNLSWNSLSKNT